MAESTGSGGSAIDDGGNRPLVDRSGFKRAEILRGKYDANKAENGAKKIEKEKRDSEDAPETSEDCDVYS